MQWEGGSETEFGVAWPGHSCVYKQMVCDQALALVVNQARESAGFPGLCLI